MEFISSKTAAYDVIIVDSSDPDGPAGTLFGEAFYKAVHKALKFAPPPAPRHSAARAGIPWEREAGARRIDGPRMGGSGAWGTLVWGSSCQWPSLSWRASLTPPARAQAGRRGVLAGRVHVAAP